MTEETHEKLKAIKQSFRSMMNGPVSQSMREKGSDDKINWGVALPLLQKMATEYGYDYDLAITEKMCELLDIHPTLRRTEEYIKLPDSTADDNTKAALIPSDGIAGNLMQWADYREIIRPKHPLPDADFQPKPYYQVYKQKFGFLPNLSILDLLFNEGNEAVLFL